jgi:hypothetical protein
MSLTASRLDFLRAMYEYISFTQTNELLKKIGLSMRESGIITTTPLDYSSMNYRHDEELLEIINEDSYKPPLHEYYQLLDGWEEFEVVKHLATEEEISRTKIEIKHKTTMGNIGTITNGWGLLNMAQYVYPKDLPSVHTYFLERLDWAESHGVFSQYFDYNNETATLYFRNKEITMNIKKIPTNAHYLLSYIFANRPFEQHYCDELNDDMALLESKHWKSYYDACIDIQSKVEKVTAITDFLDFNSGAGMYVRINPKYSLSNVPQ